MAPPWTYSAQGSTGPRLARCITARRRVYKSEGWVRVHVGVSRPRRKRQIPFSTSSRCARQRGCTLQQQNCWSSGANRSAYSRLTPGGLAPCDLHPELLVLFSVAFFSPHSPCALGSLLLRARVLAGGSALAG